VSNEISSIDFVAVISDDVPLQNPALEDQVSSRSASLELHSIVRPSWYVPVISRGSGRLTDPISNCRLIGVKSQVGQTCVGKIHLVERYLGRLPSAVSILHSAYPNDV